MENNFNQILINKSSVTNLSMKNAKSAISMKHRNEVKGQVTVAMATRPFQNEWDKNKQIN